MATTEQIEATVTRVGILAMTYYPEIILDDAEFDLAREISWCLAALSADEASVVRDDITRAVVDPTARRVAAYAALYDLQAAED